MKKKIMYLQKVSKFLSKYYVSHPIKEKQFHNHRRHSLKYHALNNGLEWTWRTMALAEDYVTLRFTMTFVQEDWVKMRHTNSSWCSEIGTTTIDQKVINYHRSYS